MLAFFRLFYHFFQLNNAERFALIRTQVNDSKSPEDWLSFFSKLHQIHLQQRAARKFLTMYYNLIIFLELIYWFIAVLYLTGAADDRDFGFKMGEYVILLDLPAKILLGVFVVLFLLRRWFNTLKLPDYVSSFIIPLLVILKEEIKKGSAIELAANLGKRTRKRNYQETKYNYKSSTFYLAIWILPYLWLLSIPLWLYYLATYEPNFWGMSSEGWLRFSSVFQIIFFVILFFSVDAFSPPYPRITTKIYKNEWLSFGVRLADKSAVSCQIIETFYEIKKKKKNPRGKIKSKQKPRMVETYTLKVTLPAKAYHISQKQVKNPDAVKQSNASTIMRKIPGETRNQIRQKSKNKYKINFSTPNLHHFLRMVGDAYRQIEKPSA